MSDHDKSGRKLKVFVSYSRIDVDIADQIVLALSDRGYQPIVDRHDIHAAENWRDRISKLIFSSGAAVFILTKSSLDSDICLDELNELTSQGKRIVPVVPKALENVTIPKALQALNWIHLYKSESIPGSGFYNGIVSMDEALSTNLEWIRFQARLMEDAQDWVDRDKPVELLLRGSLLDEANTWSASAPEGIQIDQQVLQFLNASLDEQETRNNKARESIEKERKQLARQRRLQRITAILAAAILAGSAIGGLYVWRLSLAVQVEKDNADAASAQVAISRSTVIADAALSKLEKNDIESATRLAILAYTEGLPAGGVTESNVALSLVAEETRPEGFFPGHESDIVKYVASTEDEFALSLTRDGIVRVWDSFSEIKKLENFESPVADTTFLLGAEKIITAHLDGSILEWDYSSGFENISQVSIPTPGLRQERLDQSIIAESLSRIYVLPDRSFAVRTTFGRVLLFGALNSSSYQQEEWDPGGVRRMFVMTDDPTLFVENAEREVKSASFRNLEWKFEEAAEYPDLANPETSIPASIRSLQSDAFAFTLSPDGVKWLWLTDRSVHVYDIRNEAHFRVDLGLPMVMDGVAQSPTENSVVVWNSNERMIAQFDYLSSQTHALASIDMLIDFSEPVHSMEHIELVYGEDDAVRVLALETGFVVSGPMNVENEDISNYTFADDAEFVVIKTHQDNLFAFETKTGIPISIYRSTAPEDHIESIQVTNIDPSFLMEKSNLLCASAIRNQSRSILTAEDVREIAFLRRHAGANICDGPLREPILVNGRLFGSKQPSLFASNFETALSFTLKWEGGYSDDPLNRGGRVNLGVTEGVYHAWLTSQDLPLKPVQELTRAEAAAIYLENYWYGANCDRMPTSSLAVVCFDMAVNHGPGGANRIFQRALKDLGQDVSIDGVMGPSSMRAIQESDHNELWAATIRQRRALYRNIVARFPDQEVFLRAWMNRTDDLERFTKPSGVTLDQ
nr:glycosyl hydrolase 108 family protein [Hyphomonas sp. Mor2]